MVTSQFALRVSYMELLYLYFFQCNFNVTNFLRLQSRKIKYKLQELDLNNSFPNFILRISLSFKYVISFITQLTLSDESSWVKGTMIITAFSQYKNFPHTCSHLASTSCVLNAVSSGSMICFNETNSSLKLKTYCADNY